MDKKQYNVMVCFGQLVTKMFYKDIASLHTKIFANPELVFSVPLIVNTIQSSMFV